MAKIISAAAAADREAIAATRQRYYDATARGLPMADAIAYANGGELKEPKPEPAKPLQGAQETAEARRAVVIPDDWQTLPYVPRTRGGPNLKAFAAQFSDEPILNKKQAEEAVLAEIALRAKDKAATLSGIVIPDDWQGQPLEDQVKLASQFTAEEVKTAGDVERVIQTELARRAG